MIGDLSKQCYYKKNIITIILFVVFPLFSLPAIFKGMYQLNRCAFVLYSLFMGLIGIMAPPVGDLYRYTLDFQFYSDCNWNDFLGILIVKQDIILPLLSWTFGNLGFKADIIRFIFSFSGYYLLTNLFFMIISDNNQLTEKKYRIYILGFFFPLLLTAFCYRYSLGMILFLNGAYLVFYRQNRRIGWFFWILAILTHFTFIVQVTILCFTRFRFFQWGRFTLLVIILSTLLLDTNPIVQQFLNMLPSEYSTHYMYYVDGYWAEEYVEDLTWRGKMLLILTNLVVYICIFVYYRVYNRIDPNKNSIINAMILLALLISPFGSAFARFLSVVMMSIKIVFMRSFDGSYLMIKYIRLLFLVVLFSNIMEVWTYRRQLLIGDFYKLTYSTSFNILSHSYSDVWISNHIDERGGISSLDF